MYIHELVTQLDSADITLVDLQLPILQTHHVVGVLPPELRRLYALHYASAKEFDRKKRELLQRRQPLSHGAQQRRKEAEVELLMENRKRDVLGSLFWYSVRLTFPELTGVEQISLHIGWQVAKENKHNPQPTTKAH